VNPDQLGPRPWLRAARYIDATEEVEFGEVHLFVGQDFVVSVRHSEAPDIVAGDPPVSRRIYEMTCESSSSNARPGRRWACCRP